MIGDLRNSPTSHLEDQLTEALEQEDRHAPT